MTTVQTLFGTFDENQLKTLAGAIDEMVLVMHRMDSEKESMKDIIDATYDNLKLPKKIIRKMAKVKYKQSFQSEVAEHKEFEALFEGISEVKS
jgi:hypothetical protein